MMGCNGISQTVWYGIAVVSLQNTLFSWHFNWKNDDKPRKHGMLNQKWWFVGGYINWGKLGWVAIETLKVQLVEYLNFSWVIETLQDTVSNWAWLRLPISGMAFSYCPFPNVPWLPPGLSRRLISREFEAKLYHFWSFGITLRKYVLLKKHE